MSGPMADCPTCGHNLSAFCGGCTALVLNDAGIPGYCGHDCSVDALGESAFDTLKRLLSNGHSPAPTPSGGTAPEET